MGDFIILFIVLIITVAIIGKYINNKKKGISSSCSCNCSNCSCNCNTDVIKLRQD